MTKVRGGGDWLRTVDPLLETFEQAGFEAYLVGGCVRDSLLGLEPDDFDVATNARPEEISRLFPRTVPVGAQFGTVLVLLPDADVHVTTYRKDLDYRDGRRPGRVVYGQTIEEDLSRRDFTINAIAWDPRRNAWMDPFCGRSDLEAQLIRAVGDPDERFMEDALRTLRAVRFSAQLGFDIDSETWRALERNAGGVRRLSGERIRDELIKMMESPDPAGALWMMKEGGLLFFLLPPLKDAERLPQDKKGAPTLLDHLIQTAAALPPDPILRLAGLFHDLGKLSTGRVTAEGRRTFFGHPRVGARMARQLARSLRLSRSDTKRIVFLTEMHMAPFDDIQPKTLKRWIGRYGEALVRDLLTLARADSQASGGGGEGAMEALQDQLEDVIAAGEAVSLKDLAVDGRDVMAALALESGPEVGNVLRFLHEQVLEQPALNEREKLIELAKQVFRS